MPPAHAEPEPSAQGARHRVRSDATYALSHWQTAAFLIGTAVSYVAVLAVHGFLPGQSGIPAASLEATGIVECLHDQGISSLWTWCTSVGYPVGAPRLTGETQMYLAWLVSYVPGLDAWGAHQVSNAFFDLLAFVGGIALMRRWRFPRWISVVAMTSYLTATNVISLNGFGQTFLGYVLLPAFVYVGVKVLDWLYTGRYVQAFVSCVAASLALVFMDGYAFFGGALVVGMLGLARVRERWRRHGAARALTELALWPSGLAVAALAYTLWVPGNGYETNVGLEVFGLLGVDVITLFVPSVQFLFPRVLGLDLPPLHTWGYTASPLTNYLGFVTLVLVAGYLVIGRKGGWRPGSRELVVVALAGAATLFLSLGPTLKVGQVDPGLDASLLTLPSAWLYEHVPGFSDMRATHRWLVVTRFACIALAAAGLTVLWRRWRGTSIVRGGLIVALAALMVFETAPNVWVTVDERERSIAHIHQVRDRYLAEADELLDEGELVLFLPSDNDVLVNYIVPLIGNRSYNVAGDKNYALAYQSWPDSVRAARDGYGAGSAGLLCEALQEDVDVIVLTEETMFAAALLRAPDVDGDAFRRSLALDLADDVRFDAEIGEHLVTIRSSGVDCGDA